MVYAARGAVTGRLIETEAPPAPAQPFAEYPCGDVHSDHTHVARVQRIPVYGVVAKVVYDPKPNNRGYFLKAKEGYSKHFIADNIRAINWVGNSCAHGGVFWLTKYEFVSQYNLACPYTR